MNSTVEISASESPTQTSALNFLWVVCSWCDFEFATKPCVPEMHGEITHGICPACQRKYRGAFGLA